MVLWRFLVIVVLMLGALLGSVESRGKQSVANECNADPDKELVWKYEKGPAVRHAVFQGQQTNVTSQFECQKLCIKQGTTCSLYEYYSSSRICRLSSNRTEVMSSEFVRGEWTCVHHPSRKFCRLVESKQKQKRSIIVVKQEKASSLDQCKVRCSSHHSCKAMIFKNGICYIAVSLMPNLKCSRAGCSSFENRCYRTNWIEEETTHRVSFDKGSSGEISDRNITGSLMILKGSNTSLSGPTPGVVGVGFHLAKNDRIELIDEASSSCFGNVSRCTEGLTLSLWYRTKSSDLHKRRYRQSSHNLFKSSYLSVSVLNYGHMQQYLIFYGADSLNSSLISYCRANSRPSHSHLKKDKTWTFLAVRINTKHRSHHGVRLSKNGKDIKLYCRSNLKKRLYGRYYSFASEGMASIGNKPNTRKRRHMARTTSDVDLDEYQFWDKYLPDSSIGKLYSLRKVKA